MATTKIKMERLYTEMPLWEFSNPENSVPLPFIDLIKMAIAIPRYYYYSEHPLPSSTVSQNEPSIS